MSLVRNRHRASVETRAGLGQEGPIDPAAEPAAEAEGGTDTNKGQRRGCGGDVRLTKAILKTVERPIGAGLDIPFILDI